MAGVGAALSGGGDPAVAVLEALDEDGSSRVEGARVVGESGGHRATPIGRRRRETERAFAGSYVRIA
jgi:hypothetical protein